VGGDPEYANLLCAMHQNKHCHGALRHLAMTIGVNMLEINKLLEKLADLKERQTILWGSL
jgi:hypothetical protein